jgi:hypothetical protein
VSSELKLHRGALLRRAGLGAGAVALAGPAAALAANAPGEVDALNLLLRVNRLEFAFYNDAVSKAKLRTDPRLWPFAQVARMQERGHVRHLTRLLAGAAEAPQRYDFKAATTDAKQFAEAARALEDLATQAVVGLTVRFTNRMTASQLTGLLAVDARHSAWVRTIVGGNGVNSPSPDAIENPRGEASIVRGLDELGFFAV